MLYCQMLPQTAAINVKNPPLLTYYKYYMWNKHNVFIHKFS